MYGETSVNKNTQLSIFCLAILPSLTLLGLGAEAKCQKMGFLVNDYGKDGPSKDAQDLLDKHVAKWATENKISKYTVGKKTVSCELFLNFVVFDEHTCTASANVCWDEANAGSKGKTAAAGKPQEENKKQNISKTAETSSDQTGSSSESKATAPEVTPTNAAASEAQEPNAATSEAKSPNAAASEAKSPNATGALPSGTTEEASNKDKVQSDTLEESNLASNGKTSATATPEDTNKQLNESKTIDTCAEKKPSATLTKAKSPETKSPQTKSSEAKSSEPAKTKTKAPAPKKPSSSDTTSSDPSEEASNYEEEETGASDIETGSLQLFAIGKDNQPEFSRNPLNQNN